MFNTINPKSAMPIYRQIIEQIRRAVAAGQLLPGEQLPSVRELAAQLLVNPNTISRVYRDLEWEGLIETRRGQGTYISSSAASLVDSERLQIIADQLEAAAKDVSIFGVNPETALDIFRNMLLCNSAKQERV